MSDDLIFYSGVVCFALVVLGVFLTAREFRNM